MDLVSICGLILLNVSDMMPARRELFVVSVWSGNHAIVATLLDAPLKLHFRVRAEGSSHGHHLLECHFASILKKKSLDYALNI